MDFLQKTLLIGLLVVALSVDAFVASVAYGTNQIKVGLAAAATINGICSLFLGISLAAGQLLVHLIAPPTIQRISTAILLLLGLTKLFDGAIKSLLATREKKRNCFRFSVAKIRFVLRIYADPIEADRDHSRSLSVRESAFLAVAMSLDSMVAGLGIASLGWYALLAVALSFLAGMAAIGMGYLLGERLSKYIQRDISWLSGVLFLTLAGLKWV